MNEWRKVEDELPPDERECFAYNRFEVRMAVYIGNGEWFSGDTPIIGVTHWMPVVFPDPPRE